MSEQHFAWNEETLAALRRLVCVEGKTFAAAAEKLGTSKNAVVGKAHRLGIYPSDAVASPRSAASRQAQERRWNPPRPPAADRFPPKGCCLFPIGDPRADDFHFCGDKIAAPGEPYCDDHHRLCWQPARVQRLDAAE
jgi:GcrA cell cycle regulator